MTVFDLVRKCLSFYGETEFGSLVFEILATLNEALNLPTTHTLHFECLKNMKHLDLTEREIDKGIHRQLRIRKHIVMLREICIA